MRWLDAPIPGPHPNPLSAIPAGYSISSFLHMLHPECKELPEPHLLPGQLSHGAVGVKDGRVQWISMAFESVSPGWTNRARGSQPNSAVSPLISSPRPRAEQRGFSLEGRLRPRGMKLLAQGHGIHECQHQVQNQAV